MKKVWLFLLFMTLLQLSISATSEASTDLQELINQADENTVIKLEDRSYTGNIVIEKPIELVGTKNTIIRGDGTGSVISVRAPGVTLKQLTVINSSMDRNSAEEFAAIKLYSDGNTLQDLTIRDSFHGIYLSKAHQNKITKVHITGHGQGKIASQGNGITVSYSNKNIISDNTIEATRDGMFFDYANENAISNNDISHTRYGLHYMYSDHNEFKGNVFTLNTGGAAVMNTNDLLLEKNKFVFNYGHRSFGLLLLSANRITVKNNLFFLNQRGLYIDQSTDNRIENNNLLKNQIGIELWASSNQQVFTNNQVHENTIPVATLGGQAQNYWFEDGKGNDWGKNYPLLDLDQNNIGDYPVSYQSSLYKLIEDQELTYLFLKSPAINIFEKMNELLGNKRLMFEDPYPLASDDTTLPWWYLLLGFTFIVLFIKGRKLICISFGRNGRKI